VVITLCNGKGGSGKTTLTMLLAAALIEAGHDVAVQDLDSQRTATRWARAVGSGLKLAEEGKSYSSLVIDTPPRLDAPEVTKAIRQADLVIVVSSPSPADLFASQDTAALIRSLRAEQKTRLLFNNVKAGTILARALDDFAKEIGLVSFRNHIQQRQAYQHAAVLGWKSLPSVVREELLRFAVEVTAFYGKLVSSKVGNVA
jgi:chromosome partitioning protein